MQSHHTPNTTCLHCGRDYYTKSWRVQKYCSRKCKAEAATTRVRKSCKQCGKPFSVIHARRDERFYCSPECSHIAARIPVADRFHDKYAVNPCTGCWEWQAFDGKERPRMSMEGRQVIATHVAWFLRYEVWPEHEMCHTCDNPRCVNPDHLFDGTHEENFADASAKGRMPRGEMSPTAKLCEKDVIEIRRRFNLGERPLDLARHFGVSNAAIWHVVKRNTWKHV